MDLIYTDSKGIESGIFSKFSLDFDCTDTKDFKITVGYDTEHLLVGGCRCYIDDTEYGGIIDSVEVMTDEKQINYYGRNFRAILENKIIMPKSGESARKVKGNLTDITNSLLNELSIDGVFTCDFVEISTDGFYFENYCNLYDGLVSLAYKLKKVISLKAKRDKIHINYIDRIDYSDEMEYTGNNIGFRLKKCYNSVNHLVCRLVLEKRTRWDID